MDGKPKFKVKAIVETGQNIIQAISSEQDIIESQKSGH